MDNCTCDMWTVCDSCISDYDNADNCTTCNGIAITLVSSLCDTHYFEWLEEKTYNDLDRSTEGLYL